MAEPIHNIKDLRERRAKAIADARAVHETAGKEDRELTAGEDKRYKAFIAEAEGLRGRVEREEALLKEESEIEGIQGRSVPPESPDSELDDEERSIANGLDDSLRLRHGGETASGPTAMPEYRAVFDSFIRHGREMLNDEQRSTLYSAGGEGEWITAPQQLVVEMLKDLDSETFVRQRARKFTVPGADTLGAVKRERKQRIFQDGGELTPPENRDPLAFKPRELKPQYATGEIDISRDLLRRTTIPVEGILREEINVDRGEFEEERFFFGDGLGKPLGWMVPSDQGVSTARDVSNGNAVDGVTFDGLISAKYAMKQRRWARSSWYFNPTIAEHLVKIKHPDGRYVWREDVRVGEPDRILSIPVTLSDFMPSVQAAGHYVGGLADLRFYWIADALDLEIEIPGGLTAARNNKRYYIVRFKYDGMPVLEEAFVRVQLPNA